MMADSPHLGQKIRALRKKMGMTQQELAGGEFTKSFISQIEKNHARPSLKSLHIIANRLGKPISYFLDEDYSPPSQDPDKIDHLMLLAHHLEQEDKITDAINYFKEALSLTDKTECSRRGQLYFHLGKAYRSLGQTSNAEQMLELAGVELELATDWELLSYTYNSLGDLQLNQGNIQSSIVSFENALDAAERHWERLPGLRTMTLTNLGIAYARSEQYDKARHNLLTALEQSQSTQTYYKYGDICMALGYIDFHREALEDACRFTTRAWHFYAAIENEDMQIQCKINLGSIERARHQFALAEQRLLEAAKKAKAAGLASHEAHAYEELAEVYLTWQPEASERLIQAQVMLDKALQLYTDSTRQAAVRQLLAEAYVIQGKIDEAITTLMDAAASLENSEAQLQLAEVYSRLGELYQIKGDTKQATTFLHQSVSIFKGIQIRAHLVQ